MRIEHVLRISAALLLVGSVSFSCSREEARNTATSAAEKVSNATQNAVETVKDQFDVEVPVGPPATQQQLEKERFNREWQNAQSVREAQRAAAAQAQQPQQSQPAAALPAGMQIVTGKFNESLKSLDPNSINSLPVTVPIKGDVSGPSVIKTQVLLDRSDFSPGMLDGRWGKNSEIAVWWFQRVNGLPTTGDVDDATFRALLSKGGPAPAVISYTITADDAKGPFVKIPDDVYEKEKLDCLCYESIEEEISERFHVFPSLLEAMNPGVSMKDLHAGATVFVPNVRNTDGSTLPKVDRIIVSVRGWYLHGLDANGNVVFHAPTTLGSKYDPSPNETVHITAIQFNPNFHYQPTLFHEVPDTDPEAHLKPGPNSPVGVVWMALSKPHFGIHGTEDPESIGYTSSHGCVRLTNWDARELAQRVGKGTPVEFVDTRGTASDPNKD